MEDLTLEQRRDLKRRGIILNRDRETFSVRVLTEDGTLNAGQLEVLSQAAQRFGDGRVALTVRMTVEIQRVPREAIGPLCDFLEEHGLVPGGGGNRVRPIVVCKGTVCSHGLLDTQALARELHQTFYLGWKDVPLPHKFKIGVGGCPNGCIKPDLNDFGITGWKGGCRIMLGGLWGRHRRVANLLEGVYSKKETFRILERTLTLWKEQGKTGERFGTFLDRTGVDVFLDQVMENSVG